MLPRLPRPALRAGLAGALCATLALSTLGLATLGLAPTDGAQAEPRPDRSPGAAEPRSVRHTSDGERGPIAPYVARQDDTPLLRSTPTRIPLGPGLSYTTWTQTDARGQVVAHLIAVDLGRRDLSFDVVNPGHVAAVADVRTLAKRYDAAAAINGDFYDIGRTGAPLGVGVSSRRGMLNARETGWNQGFFLTRQGRPQFGELTFTGRIRQRPEARVTNLNSHFVAPGGIGLYTSKWGRTPGYAVTQGQEQDIRMVVVRHGQVVSNRARLQPGRRIEGLVLIGRGAGAQELRKLKKGPADVSWWVRGRPRLVLTGSKLLIDDGQVMVVDDAEMHPRTAVGVDRDTDELLLLTIDGRSEESRGYTLVELAQMMQDLGADEALNLDGGGSTTMVARRKGSVKVLNDPSDETLRKVANALVVRRG